LLLDTLLNRFETDPYFKAREFENFKLFLEEIYDNFKLNVDWFLSTQKSDVMPNTFRWQGRTLLYTLPSGMDDYPRAPFLTTNEAHVDLQVWMIVSTRAISRVAAIIGKDEDASFYLEQKNSIT
jgi:mannosyl-oligosaccharide glucosidase